MANKNTGDVGQKPTQQGVRTRGGYDANPDGIYSPITKRFAIEGRGFNPEPNVQSTINSFGAKSDWQPKDEA